MSDEKPDVQAQINALTDRVEENRSDIDKNQDDIAALQESSRVARVDLDQLRVDFDVDNVLIAELESEGQLREEDADQMAGALTTARMIGAAIGIVMESNQCDQKQAWRLLAEASQSTNRKLREVADDVVMTGALP